MKTPQLKKKLKLKNRPGFSMLVELIFVAFLIGVVGISIFSTILFSDTIAQRSAHYARASQIDAQEIEILRGMSYSSIPAPYNGALLGSTETPTVMPSGSSNLTISYYDSPTNSIKQAVVTVTWLEKEKSKSVSYTTLIVNKGLNQ